MEQQPTTEKHYSDVIDSIIPENTLVTDEPTSDKTAKRIRVYKKCEHGKRVSRCAQCGGSELCAEHGRLKNQCRDCGGGSFCEHKRIRSTCKECGGGNICEHGKVRGRCVTCGGSQVCQHGRYRLSCVECGGTLICQHKRRRNTCVECGGSSICEHRRIQLFCKECKGSHICEHNRRRSQCFDCRGNSICEHEKIRCRCSLCGGSQICEHGINKQSCIECGGSQICEHKKYRNRCRICDGSLLCKSEWCETVVTYTKYDGYCVRCCIYLFPDIDVSRNYKTKENMVVFEIKKLFPDYTWICDKKVSDGCSKRRPDMFLDLGSHIIIVEVDENQHTNYDCSCENKRLMEISQDVGHRPIVFIRFNPDAYLDTSTGEIVKSCWKVNKKGVIQIEKPEEWATRIRILKEQIHYWTENLGDKTVEVVELFY